jgi:hypothetical protein
VAFGGRRSGVVLVEFFDEFFSIGKVACRFPCILGGRVSFSVNFVGILLDVFAVSGIDNSKGFELFFLVFEIWNRW